MNGQELPVGRAVVSKGELVSQLGAYQVRTFALKLSTPLKKAGAKTSQTVALPYDISVTSADGTKSSPGFDAEGRALPAETLPRELEYAGIRFQLGSAAPGKANAVISKGQTISLPAARLNRLYVLAASSDGDQKATFRIGNDSVDLNIQYWGGFIGQWDDRQWKQKEVTIPPRTPPPGTPPDIAAQTLRPRTRIDLYNDMTGIIPGFIKRTPVAWFASHRHTDDGANEFYAYSYLFAYVIDVPANAKTLTLPNNDRIRILAVTVANETGQIRPAQPLYDTLERVER